MEYFKKSTKRVIITRKGIRLEGLILSEQVSYFIKLKNPDHMISQIKNPGYDVVSHIRSNYLCCFDNGLYKAKYIKKHLDRTKNGATLAERKISIPALR